MSGSHSRRGGPNLTQPRQTALALAKMARLCAEGGGAHWESDDDDDDDDEAADRQTDPAAVHCAVMSVSEPLAKSAYRT